ncbi:MAG: DUF2569 domain-containing protein [Candidatus Sphingomonas colombiensis]|nr:DUF2569 domain-containing protein [Sphingomonas sp.]WEK42498.1 MAG: DUF2569 domain-containing protein [Sphingomonas sp.]
MKSLIEHPAGRALSARSLTLVCRLEVGLPRLLLAWVILAGAACGLRLAFSATPMNGTAEGIANALPYALVVGVPVATVLFGLSAFPASALHAQPTTRLARLGDWKGVGAIAARSMPLYGASGLMASLMIGILINVPVRTLEFLTGIPALGGMPPEWFRTLYTLMVWDLLLLSSLYGFAFVLALRHIPLFPRFLAGVWVMDILMQICIARIMGQIAHLPRDVAASLADLLEGNLKKVLISVAIWLPYLVFSRRVNLTYRWRVPAAR